MEKVRTFFKVQTNYQLFMVNLVFALTGTSSLVCADYILKILYVNPDTFGIVSYWTIRIILILPIYQVLLIFVGAIFGPAIVGISAEVFGLTFNMYALGVIMFLIALLMFFIMREDKLVGVEGIEPTPPK